MSWRSAAFLHDDTFRALEMVGCVPAGCFGIIVIREDFHPHLRHAEVAIVDPSDTVAQHGELYAIEVHQHRGGRPTASLAIVQAYGRDGGLCVRYSFQGPGLIPMSDGPFTAEGWRQKCAGRIIGAMRPTWQACR